MPPLKQVDCPLKGNGRHAHPFREAPARNLLNTSEPSAMAIGKPAALHTEKRPPSQSQIGKKLLLGIPICSGASNFEETTTTCLERSFPSMPALLNQFNISAELACVSSVLKLFEEITTKV